jgi:LysR family transcriptional regulator, glycine cleavage system transcriptional activator
MTYPRRFLPPISLLCAFESAARHQSFTTAAKELNLTQSAVSRQIRALEEILGSDLFHRERQTVKLTVAGSAYAREIREALARIAGATLSYRANPSNSSLHLGVLPTFGTRWLTPRLPGFLERHPGIMVNLSTRFSPFNFAQDNIDAAIHFGSEQWPGTKMELLMHEYVVPACSAELRDRLGLATAEDLKLAPLLHLVSRPDAWERWFNSLDVKIEELHGMLFDQFALMAQAAAAGIGVALLPEFLIQAELDRGELVKVVPNAVQSIDSYYLVWPSTHEHHPALELFKNWLMAEASATV